MKICSKCCIEKSLSEFYRRSDRENSHFSQCKKCVNKTRNKLAREQRRRKMSKKKREWIKLKEQENIDEKVCRTCFETKPLTEYHKSKTSWKKVSEICKKCRNKQEQIARKRRKYGITLEDYEQIFKKQNGKCAICMTKKPGGPANIFVVDHNHKTNKVRALLCNRCNISLGLMEDDPSLLRKAADYLESYNG